MNLLIVEDDTLLAESARMWLAQQGFVVDCVDRMDGVRARLESRDYHCMLLDLGLPDGDGLVLLERLRKEGNAIPIIIITARYDLEQRIRGLEMGADDYIAKPYSLDELTARIRAVTRRAEGRASNIIQVGQIRYDPSAGKVTKGDEVVELSASELRLLRYFMENSGKVLSRSRLLRALRGDEGENLASNVMDVHIHHLRRKLGADCIKTVRGMGYVFMNTDGQK